MDICKCSFLLHLLALPAQDACLQPVLSVDSPQRLLCASYCLLRHLLGRLQQAFPRPQHLMDTDIQKIFKKLLFHVELVFHVKLVYHIKLVFPVKLVFHVAKT